MPPAGRPSVSRHHARTDARAAAGPRDRRPGYSLAWCALAGALAAAGWWLVAQSMPTERVVSDPAEPPLKMHLAEVVPTDAIFREPARAFSGDAAYWRIAIRDAQERPVAAARVHVDVVAPDGAVRARPVTTTGSDGLALFAYSLGEAGPRGVYTVRVVDVSREGGNAEYDRAASVARSTSFSVSTRPRP
jgi:hypothetical protein